MRFWFQKSDKQPRTAYVAAEHKGVTAFATLTLRGIVRGIGALCAAEAFYRRMQRRGKKYR